MTDVTDTDTDTDTAADLTVSSFLLLEQAARALHLPEGDVSATLDAIVRHAVPALGVVREAGIMLLVRGRTEQGATIGTAPKALYEWQHTSGSGPAFEAAQTRRPACIDDVAQDGPWPAFRAVALAAGVRSVLSLPLVAGERALGALNLYADEPGAFSEEVQMMAGVYATLAALALVNAQQASQLSEALLHRDVIGQAKGILMERHKLTADQAFSVLVAASQRGNVKLATVAEQLAGSGELSI